MASIPGHITTLFHVLTITYYRFCLISDDSSTISSEIIVLIVVSIIFASICFSLCSACISLFVYLRRLRRGKSNDNDDNMSNATEMTRSTVSTQPIPPPRPSDLPPLSTPTNSAFSPTFSPFSPFDTTLPLPPPRPHHLGSLTTPTKLFNPLLSPFPMPQSIYESTPVYVAPGNTGRPIYIEPSKMNQELPPPYPNCTNHYERTPTGALLLDQSLTDSSVHYESIPPLVYNTYTVTTSSDLKLTSEIPVAKTSETVDEDEYEKLRSPGAEIKEGCYDNLEPQSSKALVICSDEEQEVQDEQNLQDEKELANSYVNLKEIQIDEMQPYDLLQPAKKMEEPYYDNPTISEEETCQPSQDNPHYENISKDSKMSCKVEESQASEMS